MTWKKPEQGPEPTSYEVVAKPTKTVHNAPGTSTQLDVDGLEAGAEYMFEIRSVTADGKSEPATTGAVTPKRAPVSSIWRVSSWLLAVIVIVAGVIIYASNAPDHTREGLTLACGVLGVGLVLLSAIGGEPYGLWRAVIGTDGRVSTSYLTTAVWTVLLMFVLAYFVGRTWFEHESGLFNGFVPGSEPSAKATATVWDDYLILLGGPFAALVAARGIVASKVASQTVQKTLPDDGSAALGQALTNDKGNLDLVDSQYLLFNIVALTYVVVALFSTNHLPEIPAILLALTGSAAATYVLNKAVSNSAPVVTSVLPSTVRPGQRIVISGTNLMPSGTKRAPTVTIGGKQALVDATATDTRVTVTVPPDAEAGVRDLLLTTAARATADGRPVQVLADKPQILAIDPPVPAIGQEMTIRGTGFTSALDPHSLCVVLIGATPCDATPTELSSGAEELKFQVPASTAAGKQNVKVRTPRQTESDAVEVTFKT